ncbi:MAG: nucleotidyltransferase family protein [candidate division WOR-3 bacterium]
MTIEEITEKLRIHKPELIKKYKIKDIGIFGSYVRGEQKNASDVDILVEFENDVKLSLLDVAGLEIELSELLGVKVDLVEKKTLKPYIGQNILKEVIYV